MAYMGTPNLSAGELDFAVMISATPQASPAQINLTWPVDPTATEYRISRKLAADTSFTTLATITSGAATLAHYLDNTVAVGTGYEYEVRRVISGDSASGYGYISSAIDLPLVENRGKLVLLVDDSMVTPLVTELARLEADLRGDGWTVLRHDVSRTATVPSVKALITTAYAADPTQVKCVFLFGHIPVPYSGDINPDGHPEHKGAWPADCYYGDMDGNWYDTYTNDTGSSKYGTRNHNVPGDGKFDQSSMPGFQDSRIELMVGRVDLSSLPAYAPLTETQLLKRYLDKDNAWRQGTVSVNRRGLIDENSNSVEKFASGGFRMFGALFGSANTIEADYTGTLPNNAYLASYGDGAGDTNSCAGVVTTSNFAANDYRTVFTFLFGSYFADWDSTDNLLRAAIASPTYTLTSTWGSRPYPVYHTLGMGDPIGAGIRLTQNLSGNEYTDIYKPSYPLTYNYDTQIHMALMGDPTLRLHPVKPATNLQQTTSTSPSQVTLTWTDSSDTNIVGYHVYRSTSQTSTLTRLTGTTVTTANPTGSAITGTTYIDTTAVSGTYYHYMVKAVKLETANTGTYNNFSQGVSITNAPTPPVMNPGQAASGTVSLPFSYSLIASNTPTSYALASGTLPSGVTLNTTSGLLSGTPTTAGTDTPSFTATNGSGTSTAQSVTITILDAILTGTVSGSTPYQNNPIYNANKVFDGDTATFFAHDPADGSYVQIDLGESLTGKVSTLRFFPLSDFTSRMIGGVFQGSNNGTSWTALYTVPSNPSQAWQQIVISDNTFYRYLRYQQPTGFADVAEIEFRGITQSTGSVLTSFRTDNGLATDGTQDLLIPAGDGVQNLLKYAFNMIGSGSGQAAALTTSNTTVLAAAGNAGLPLGGVESASGALQTTYIRRKASPAPGIIYAVEFSDTLGTWSVNTSATESVTSIDAAFERVTVTDSLGSPNKRFVRVSVTTN